MNDIQDDIFSLFHGRCALNPAHRATVLHHIIPRSIYVGDPDTPENLIPLCNECHSMIHQKGTRLYRLRLQEIRGTVS
jgi:5-methylcytosine-specific restriction endonuclease McrA